MVWPWPSGWCQQGSRSSSNMAGRIDAHEKSITECQQIRFPLSAIRNPTHIKDQQSTLRASVTLTFTALTQLANRRPDEIHSRAAWLIRIQVVKQRPQRFLVDLHCTWPAATQDPTSRTIDLDTGMDTPTTTVVPRDNQFVRPLAIAADSVNDGRQHNPTIVQDRQVVTRYAEVGKSV